MNSSEKLNVKRESYECYSFASMKKNNDYRRINSPLPYVVQFFMGEFIRLKGSKYLCQIKRTAFISCEWLQFLLFLLLLSLFLIACFLKDINNLILIVKAKTTISQLVDSLSLLSSARADNFNSLNKKSNKPISININFQKTGSKMLIDYFPDSGQLYGIKDNGLSYGWDQDISKTVRKRGSNNSVDNRFDTLIHMQLARESVNAVWEIELPNGEYNLRLVVGDPDYTNGYYQVMAEDILVVDGAPDASHRWFDETVRVTISDGRLTLSSGPKSISNKLAFLELWQDRRQSDLIPPSDAFAQRILSDDKKALLSWDYSLFDVKGVLVLNSLELIKDLPEAGINYSAGDMIGRSQVVYAGEKKQVLLNDLKKDITYTFKLFAYDADYDYASGVIVNGLLHKMDSIQEKKVAVDMFEQLQKGVSPDVIDYVYKRFTQTHFGAERDPLIYQRYGMNLSILDGGDWSHISQHSAVFSWQTNLPARSYVEYGETTGYGSTSNGSRTAASERYYSLHLHYLKNLKPGTVYQYRLVSNDERGHQYTSDNRTFTTDKHNNNVIYLPAKNQKAPYVLDKDGATYLLTEDISAFSSAFIIKAGNITLDMGGYTVGHANAPLNVDKKKLQFAGMGIYGGNKSRFNGLKIVNGIIQQGGVYNHSFGQKGGLNSIYLSAYKDVEIAGVTIDYHTAQTYGMFFRKAGGQYNIHHNIFVDHGWEINNRHDGGGSRSLYFASAPRGENSFTLHHNLVKRTRQNGFHKAQRIVSNEIYVDSWSTNAFAIQPNSLPDTAAGKIVDNRIFLTGYHAIGISWAHLNLDVFGNFIHMQGVNTAKNRWYESFGDQNSLNGLRLTNYGKGGQLRDQLEYDNNLIIGTARNGSQMRGTELFSDYSVSNVVVSNSTIKINVEGADTNKAAAVVTQGTKSITSKPLFYKDNHLSSNVNIIRFGDDYGRGYNHHFERCRFIRTGNRSDFHTLIFDGGYSRDGHVLLDSEFGKGTAYDDVYWERTGDLSSYSVQWTLTVYAEPGTLVSILDIDGKEVFNGIVAEKGRLNIPLIQAVIRPVEWTPQSKGKGVRKKSEHQKIFKTPHRVIINGNKNSSQVVIMDQQKKLYFTKETR